jgi:hypothetical protein
MSQAKIILYNSPKGCGKDASIHHLRSLGYPLVRREAKGKLHELTMAFFCIQPERYWEIYEDRVLKETPLPEFRLNGMQEELRVLRQLVGATFDIFDEVRLPHITINRDVNFVNLSIREAMIYISEIIMKPRFGANFFGVARAKAIVDGEIAVDSSTGFIEELPPLIERLGQENILLIRVHREGATFEGDSRNYIPDGVIDNTVDVDSVYGYLDEYLEHVEKIVDKFLNK